MRLVHFVVNIWQKRLSSATFKSVVDSALGHEGWQTASSKSMGPQQKNADDRNRSVSSAVQPTFGDLQTADVDDQ